MKTCTKCNLSYSDDKKFCKECGDELISIDSTQPKKGAKVIKIVLGAILVALGLLYILSAFYFLFQFSTQSNVHEPSMMDSGIMMDSGGIAIPFLIVRFLIGAGILTGGYFLYKSGKKKVKMD